MSSEATLYLHLGLPKTASTHLQRSVFPLLRHVDVRSMPSTELFDTPRDRQHGRRLMAACFTRSVEVWTARGDEVFAELLGEASPPERPRERGLLVSEEGMGRTASRPGLLARHLRTVAERARAWGFATPRVLCVIRAQDRWLASHYAQGADQRPGASQADFEAVAAETIDPAGERYGFGMLLDHGVLHRELCAAVGAEHVTVLPFEWLERDPGRFHREVLRAVGTDEAERARILGELGGGRTNVKATGARTWTLPRAPLLPGPARRVLPAAVHRRVEWRCGAGCGGASR